MKNQKSFTLIELLVVIAIIGLLSAIVFVNLSEARKLARDAKRKIDLNQITKALELYYDKYGHYPRQTFDGDFHNFARSVNSQPWIIDEHDGTSISEFINPIPIDPINKNPYGPWVDTHYSYAYATDADGQMYDIIALLENKNDQNRCELECWKMYSVSEYESSDYYWCGDCGGGMPYGVPKNCNGCPYIYSSSILVE